MLHWCTRDAEQQRRWTLRNVVGDRRWREAGTVEAKRPSERVGGGPRQFILHLLSIYPAQLDYYVIIPYAAILSFSSRTAN